MTAGTHVGHGHLPMRTDGGHLSQFGIERVASNGRFVWSPQKHKTMFII